LAEGGLIRERITYLEEFKARLGAKS